MASKTTKKTNKRSAPASKTPARTQAASRKSNTKTPTATKSVPAKLSAAETKSTPSEKTAANKNPIRFKRSYVLAGLIVLIIALLLYVFRGVFLVAIVNGQPISRVAVIHELERQGGKQALNSIISKVLIEQEARKQHVTVSQDDINNEVKKIETSLASQGQKLDQVLAAQGMTMASLQDQLKYQVMIDKILGKDVTVSDKEVNDYIAKNKDSLPKNLSQADLKKTVADQLRQQKINDKVQPWLDNLQKNAKINYIVNY